MSEYKFELGLIVPDGISGKIVGALLGAVVLAMGVCVVRMGLEGKTAAETLKPEEVPGFILFGVLFVWGGVQTTILSLVGRQLPRWAHVIMITVFLLVLGAPFLVIGFLDPDSVTGTVKLFNITLYQSQGGLFNRIGFVGAGSLVLAAIPFAWRWMLAKK
jgi:hypothetical protein